jgi:hypothetical protein
MVNFGIIGHQTCNLRIKILQSEITGTQTSFSNKFGDKLIEFRLVFPFFPERLSTVASCMLTAPPCTTATVVHT